MTPAEKVAKVLLDENAFGCWIEDCNACRDKADDLASKIIEALGDPS